MKQIEHQSYNALATWLHADYRKLAELHQQHGTWSQAYQKNADEAGDREALWRSITKNNIRIILPTDIEFPGLLLEIPWTPHALYALGAPLTTEPKLAIVGTRKATSTGLALAKRFSRDISNAGLTIVSGLALGIDAAAHEGALENNGKTVAVLACGLDTLYPKQNEQLAHRILKSGGTIISEYPPKSPALQQRFLERNRITSGLCNGILVIEAPVKSGVKSTARFAVEQNREVFVVPVRITHINYAGSHQLIRSGAELVTQPSEILEHLGIKSETEISLGTGARFDKLEEKHKIIIQALHENGAPLSIDALAARTEMTAAEVSEYVTLLTLDGIIKEEGGQLSL